MELLFHDVVEQILVRLPPKSLLRFKSVSKKWKSTIESRVFQHNHLTHHRQKSKTPDLLMINTDCKVNLPSLESIITLELESSISHNIPILWENNRPMFCQNSIDGLVCIYNAYDSTIIFNPTTRWYRILPPSIFQQRPNSRTYSPLGFGKDQINGLYKLVWLYNSGNATTCEVFDFKINAWRLVEPSSPERISVWGHPVYLNGLMYWLTENVEFRSVLSFDLHTETFEIVCKAPFSYMMIFNLDDNLCGSSFFDRGHVIWSWNLEEKTWNKMYSIDWCWFCPLFEDCGCIATPLAFVEEKKKKLILCDYDCCYGDIDLQVVLYNESHTTPYRVVASKNNYNKTLCYSQSLVSIS